MENRNLSEELEQLRAENTALKARIQLLETQLGATAGVATQASTAYTTVEDKGGPLNLDEIRRYGRQLILPGLGVSGRQAPKGRAVD